MQHFEELNKEELDALVKVGEHSTKDSYSGKEVCYDCAASLVVTINIGLHHKGTCAKCRKETTVYEVE